MGISTRPNEFALLLGGFTVAMFFRPRHAAGDPGPSGGSGSFIFLAGDPGPHRPCSRSSSSIAAPGRLGADRNRHTKNNQDQQRHRGGRLGSSNVPYSTDPLLLPPRLYTVLFDPLPITARSITQLLASGENTVILVLVLTSLRRLRLIVTRAGRERPFVILCAVYTPASSTASPPSGTWASSPGNGPCSSPSSSCCWPSPYLPRDNRRSSPGSSTRQITTRTAVCEASCGRPITRPAPP